MPKTPPSLSATIRWTQTLRFKTIAALSAKQAITRQTLLQLYVVGTGTNTADRLYTNVKLNSVRMWGLAGAGTDDFDAVDLAIEWFSNFTPGSVKTVSGNAFNTATLMSKPPRQSLAGYWCVQGQNESEVLFTLGFPTATAIVIPKGFVLDLNLSFVINGQSPSSTATTQTASVGTIYRGALDGVGSGTSSWESVGYPVSIF